MPQLTATTDGTTLSSQTVTVANVHENALEAALLGAEGREAGQPLNRRFSPDINKQRTKKVIPESRSLTQGG